MTLESPARSERGTALALTEVRKSYDGRPALAGISLSVSPGRTLALIGPSGCGKSTLLRLVLGLIAPDSGSITFGDLPVVPRNLKTIRGRVGYVIQDGGLFPHLTAAQNVTLKARDLGWPRGRIAARLDELTGLARFPAELLGRYPIQLSGGQKQRVGLMRALMLDPELLLMDEPLGALDPMIRSRLQTELRQIFRGLGKTVVLVTHDLAEAAYLGDEIVLMRDGTVVQRATWAELSARPRDGFVEEFVRAQRGHYSDVGGDA